jgi:hypothetical protein
MKNGNKNYVATQDGLLVVSLISLKGGANPHWKILYF